MRSPSVSKLTAFLRGSQVAEAAEAGATDAQESPSADAMDTVSTSPERLFGAFKASTTEKRLQAIILAVVGAGFAKFSFAQTTVKGGFKIIIPTLVAIDRSPPEHLSVKLSP